MEPDNVETYDYRADVYQQQGNLDLALAEYDHATKIDPTYAAAFFSRGPIYEKKGDLAMARGSWKRALTLKPEPDVKQRLEEKLRKTESLDAKK